MFERQTFGQRTPSLNEMIPHISAAIDRRFLIRRNLVGNKRLKYYHENPLLKEALEKASWVLNPTGMKLLFDNIKLCEKQWANMAVVDSGIMETFQNGEQKMYTTDGKTCSCSYFHQMFFCRHIILYRIDKALPVFTEEIFHSCLHKNPQIASSAPLSEFQDEFDISPPSPGMEMIISEERKKRKNPTQAMKFNKALDLGKEMAEIMCTYDSNAFEEVLETCGHFLKQIRRGIPPVLSEYLKFPTNFLIVPVASTTSVPGTDNYDNFDAEHLTQPRPPVTPEQFTDEFVPFDRIASHEVSVDTATDPPEVIASVEAESRSSLLSADLENDLDAELPNSLPATFQCLSTGHGRVTQMPPVASSPPPSVVSSTLPSVVSSQLPSAVSSPLPSAASSPQPSVASSPLPLVASSPLPSVVSSPPATVDVGGARICSLTYC